MLTFHHDARRRASRTRCRHWQLALAAALASTGATYTVVGLLVAAYDDGPQDGSVRRDSRLTGVFPTPGADRGAHSPRRLRDTQTQPTWSLYSVLLGRVTARETPAAMATIERINSSSSLLAGMTLSARRPPWAVGPSRQSAKENREQATQRHHNKSPRTWGTVAHLLQA